ncbi:hypothetical protein SAMN04487762_0923 [Polaribacter sp. Hel1_33_78]|jgi:hypothetical protein|uniref:DUF6377 domain-containing protein n=1 Tax=Polaribacter sp. Hel1_33_78 TaxID=1336804 RepID=UPI00087B7710|nr:DUF6377 domain-containing protein [Polaribacter sp. Hel1_33_78]SDT96147.1 hypothetical protein SAMN04487762_0923 [Polaribacter sp. Hel1_33_78]
MFKFFLVFTLLANYSYASNHIDSLLITLESKMNNRLIFDNGKEKTIDNYKTILADSLLKDETRFLITKKLIYELEYYSFDAALYYSLENQKLASKINNPLFISESKILIAKILMESGRYKESLDILNEIQRKKIPSELLSSYFFSLKEGYSELSYYSSIQKNKDIYYQLYNKYQDSLSNILPKSSDEILRLKEKELRDNRQLDEALKVNEIRIKGKKSGTRLFSLITFERSLLYELAKNTTQEKKYLILSAISDIEASVKDNASLSKLAMIFYKENKIYKAHKYINFSLDDAKFFNSKLRFINLSKILTLITEAYEKQSDHQKNKLTNSLYFISALAAFLFFTLIFIYKQNKNLSIARKQLKNNNAELKNLNSQLNNSNNELKDLYQKLLKADLVKEKYVGTFLNLYSDYINKLDLYRKLVKKHIKLDRIDELLKITESKQVIDTEIKIFHKNFDESFLHIYPNFIEQFNTLLKKDKQVTLKKGELLNTELRIYALIRLGINNSDQIATILRYSVSTIYNYRVKLKNNSLHTRDNFEDEVKKIS